MSATSTGALIDGLLDADTFRGWDDRGSVRPITALTPTRPPSTGYAAALRNAAVKAQRTESILAGEGCVGGHRIALIASDFTFMGGTIGTAAARVLTKAIRRATRERLPVIASPCSGGTRMQEGTLGFLTMLDITEAVMEHQRAGLPYITYLRHPTMGGALASWGSLGDLTLAEPDAMIGFLGPRVFHALTGATFPTGVQSAENLLAHRLVDGVMSHTALRDVTTTVLGHLRDPCREGSLERRSDRWAPTTPVWARVEASRKPDHLSYRHVLDRCSDVVAVGGNGETRGISAAIARLDGMSAVVVGHNRGAANHGATLGPADLVFARRCFDLAERWNLPVVTLIDTAGADLSADAENNGLAREIALCLARLQSLSVPTVSVLAGQGAGGGALALFAARTRVALPSAWLAPLPPEGASAIIHSDVDHAPQMAQAQRIGVEELIADGSLLTVIPDRPGDTNHTQADALLAEVRAQILNQRRERKP